MFSPAKVQKGACTARQPNPTFAVRPGGGEGGVVGCSLGCSVHSELLGDPHACLELVAELVALVQDQPHHPLTGLRATIPPEAPLVVVEVRGSTASTCWPVCAATKDRS